jgi:DNA-binding SARP family transcriptional activator
MPPADAEDLQQTALHALQDPAIGAAPLRDVFDRELAAGDPLRTLVAAAALICCQVIGDESFHHFTAAVDALFANLGARERLTAPAPALLVAASEFSARFYREMADPELPAMGETLVRSATERRIDASLRCVAAICAAALFDEMLDLERIRWAEIMLREVRADPALPAQLAAEWDLALVRAYHLAHRYDRSDALRTRWSPEALAARPRLALKLAMLDARTTLAEGRVAAARDALRRAEALLGPRTLASAGRWHFLSSRLALLDNRSDDALTHARVGVRLLRDAEYPLRWMGPAVMQEGQVLVARGDFFGAVPFFEAAGRADSGVQADYCWCLAHAARALGHADAGDETALVESLAAALTTARRLGWIGFLGPNPRAAARLCSLALEHEIEAEFARRVIAERGFDAPRPDQAAWPWPIRVRLLGGQEIEVDGRALALRGKGARKPLELLQFIVASGGSEVPTGSAAFALWPDLDGDNAKSALNVALHRLRKLLAHDEAIELELGKLALAPASIWVDCIAFEHLVDELRVPLTPAQARVAAQALALYRGPWRKDEDDRPWQMVYRSRLVSKFKRVVRALVAYRVEHAEWASARDLLERALELDPLAEDLARELMRLLATQGEAAAALAAFERCRAAIAASLGARPSEATVQLAAELRADGAADFAPDAPGHSRVGRLQGAR